MSNYADPEATRPISLGPCRCPHPEGRPPWHETDSADVVVRLGYGALANVRRAGRLLGDEAFNQAAIAACVKRWTLVLPDGKPRPVSPEQIALLDESAVRQLIGDATTTGLLDECFAEDPLPNDSGGPSPAGTPEQGSPTPTTPEPTSSTST